MDSNDEMCFLCFTPKNEVFGQKLASLSADKDDDVIIHALDNVFGLNVSNFLANVQDVLK